MRHNLLEISGGWGLNVIISNVRDVWTVVGVVEYLVGTIVQLTVVLIEDGLFLVKGMADMGVLYRWGK